MADPKNEMDLETVKEEVKEVVSNVVKEAESGAVEESGVVPEEQEEAKGALAEMDEDEEEGDGEAVTPKMGVEGGESSAAPAGGAVADGEIILISPKWAELPATWSSVEGVSVCCDRNLRFRRSMEDAHVILECFNGNPKESFWAIYDGHGGRQAVEYVSANLHKNFKKELERESKVTEALRQAYLITDDELGTNNIMYSGTTCATCFLRDEGDQKVLYVANCGDARAVLCRDGKAVRLTVDHKANDEAEVERIRSAGGFVVMNRVNGILAVARSLGDRTMKEYVTGEPYTTEVVLQEKDSHLIVACDGVWDILEDQQACDIVMKETTMKKKAERLVGHSLKGGSTDNISVIVIKL
eukprot:CAMPEP_0119120172 /NCGR_PEP_ID=MMETSP1310-20130426/1332_1 /TAXON_ID=464262 /ORGANISM="Genus nov. species nov., Strain RCC2339" /LENGTH=355 /DNA_ID=CAMNT_0007109639 /DNA_START=98 /DNA_END=1165 /DNA_ORIENTATION=+